MTRNKYPVRNWRPNAADVAVLEWLAANRPDDSDTHTMRRAIRALAKKDGCKDATLLALTPETKGRPPNP